MRNDETNRPTDRVAGLKALASPVRLGILRYLKDPLANFPPQVDGDLVQDGVCSDFIREKIGVSAATVSRHLALLAGAGFVIAKRQRGWTFYRRNEAAIRRFAENLKREI